MDTYLLTFGYSGVKSRANIIQLVLLPVFHVRCAKWEVFYRLTKQHCIMEADTIELHSSIAQYVYEEYPGDEIDDEITSVYIAEQVGLSPRPQMHRMYLTEVAVLYEFGPDGHEKTGYQIPLRHSQANDFEILGAEQMAAFADRNIQSIDPYHFDSQPQPIKFEGSTDLIDAIINNMKYADADGFEIIRPES